MKAIIYARYSSDNQREKVSKVKSVNVWNVPTTFRLRYQRRKKIGN